MPLFGFPFQGRSGGGLGEVFYKHFPSRNPFLHGLSERFGEVGRSFSKFHLFIDCYSSVSLPSLDNFHVWGRNLRPWKLLCTQDLWKILHVQGRNLRPQICFKINLMIIRHHKLWFQDILDRKDTIQKNRPLFLFHYFKDRIATLWPWSENASSELRA